MQKMIEEYVLPDSVVKMLYGIEITLKLKSQENLGYISKDD